MGLFDALNSYEGQQALGLLAAAGGRSDGAGFGQRMLEGLGQGEKWKAQQAAEKRALMQDQLNQLQMQDYLAKAEKQKRMQSLGAQFSTPRVGMSADGYGPSAPATFDRQGYAAALEAIDPVAGLEYAKSIQKNTGPISVAKGTTLLDPATMKPIFQAPTEDDLDPKIKQYEYAKKGGYKGTFEQFVTLAPTIMASAQAPLRQAQVENIREENAYNLPAPRQSTGVSVTTPDGRTFTFPNQAAANNFKLKAGIR